MLICLAFGGIALALPPSAAAGWHPLSRPPLPERRHRFVFSIAFRLIVRAVPMLGSRSAVSSKMSTISYRSRLTDRSISKWLIDTLVRLHVAGCPVVTRQTACAQSGGYSNSGRQTALHQATGHNITARKIWPALHAKERSHCSTASAASLAPRHPRRRNLRRFAESSRETASAMDQVHRLPEELGPLGRQGLFDSVALLLQQPLHSRS